jgi:hypothetical protein
MATEETLWGASALVVRKAERASQIEVYSESSAMNWEPATAPSFFYDAKTPAEESAVQLGVPDPVAKQHLVGGDGAIPC